MQIYGCENSPTKYFALKDVNTLQKSYSDFVTRIYTAIYKTVQKCSKNWKNPHFSKNSLTTTAVQSSQPCYNCCNNSCNIPCGIVTSYRHDIVPPALRGGWVVTHPHVRADAHHVGFGTTSPLCGSLKLLNLST